jgi:ornithine cyclodeaminase/alanine dehydrogenase-like protein (mu-crystallin family)
MTWVFNNQEVEQALDLNECLEAFEEAYREQAAGRAVNRPTSQCYLPHALPESSYSFKSVEGGIGNLGVLALRITSDILREERVNGSPRLNKIPLAGNSLFVGLVQLFSTETGELLAIMPDGFIQQTRVGVTSALGVKCLARRNSSTLGLIGTGGQARSHLRTFLKVRAVTSVKVFSPNPEHRKEFAATMERECEVEIRPVSSVAEAVRDCDIVCTATNASRPLMTRELLEPGMHYNAIREFEIDESVFERSDVVAIHTRFGGIYHYLPAGQKEDPPGMRREKERDWSRYPEISDLLAGRAQGRTDNRQITFFLNNVGTGVQFAALGYCAYRGARKMGLGRELPTEWFLQDIKP